MKAGNIIENNHIRVDQFLPSNTGPFGTLGRLNFAECIFDANLPRSEFNNQCALLATISWI